MVSGTVSGRYYKAQVDDIIPRCFFEVIFDDYSYSNNLLPEDIVVSPLLCRSLSLSLPHAITDAYAH